MFMNIPHTKPNNNFRCLSHDSLPLYSGTISLWLCSLYNCFLKMTSGFHHKVEEDCTLLGYYAASSVSRQPIGPNFRSHESKRQDGTNWLSWNISKKLPVHAAYRQRRAQFSTASQISDHNSQKQTLSRSKNSLTFTRRMHHILLKWHLMNAPRNLNTPYNHAEA